MLVKSNTECIPYIPRRVSSSQVGMEFYSKCTSVGLKLVTEYRINNCRFDAVLVRDGNIILIIEFKSSRKIPNITSKQCTKYVSHGVDVLYIMNLSQVDKAVETAKHYWYNF